MPDTEAPSKTFKTMQTFKLAGGAAGIATAILLLPSCNAENDSNQPDIIVFLADDPGYGDLACIL